MRLASAREMAGSLQMPERSLPSLRYQSSVVDDGDLAPKAGWVQTWTWTLVRNTAGARKEEAEGSLIHSVSVRRARWSSAMARRCVLC